MARIFGRIETSIWQNAKFRALSDDGRVLWLYTLCCPHGNAVGCFVLPEGYIMADLGWSAERVSETVSELLRNGLIDRCETTSLTLVRGWWGHNTIENRNVAKAAIKTIEALPRCPLFFKFIKAVDRFPEQLRKEFRNRYPNGLPNGIETKEPEPEPETESSSVSSLRSDTGAVAPSPDGLEVQEFAPGAAVVRGRADQPDLSDQKVQLYDRGREVLGKSAGGQITKLLRAQDGSIPKARAIIETASTRANPAEYVAAVIHGKAREPDSVEARTKWAV